VDNESEIADYGAGWEDGMSERILARALRDVKVGREPL
jgi:hypothetical protein